MEKSLPKWAILVLLAFVTSFSGCRAISDALDLLGRVIGVDSGAIFFAYDTPVATDEPAELLVRLQSKFLFDMEDVTIGFYYGDEELGTVVTDDNGAARLTWTPPGPGDHLVEARILAIPDKVPTRTLEVAPTALLVTVRPPETPFVVIDLDRTLVGSGFRTVLAGEATPMDHSKRVVRRLGQDYSLIYLTHRPNLLIYASKTWLTEHDYPLAPLLVSEWSQTLGPSGEFKTARLAELRETFPHTRIGIGDKLSDAEAYIENDMIAYLIPFYDPNSLRDLRQMAEDLAQLEGHGRLHVVSDWLEIEAGIYEGRQFPPEEFIEALIQRRQRLLEQP